MKLFFSIIFALFLMQGFNNFAFGEIDLSSFPVFSNLKDDKTFDYSLAATQAPIFLLGDSPAVFIKKISRMTSPSDKVSMSLFVFDNSGSLINTYSDVTVKKQPKVSDEYKNSHCDESANELERNYARPLKWLEFNFRIF